MKSKEDDADASVVVVDPNGNELGEMAKAESYLGTPRQIICKFIMFAVFFSLNHGCVTGVLAYVQVFFGDVAQVSVSVLYGVYTGTALLLSAVIVDWATYKYALLGGLILYCIYVACYAIGGGFPDAQTPVIIAGAVVGGFSAGFLWTAQGPYFKAFADQVPLRVLACLLPCWCWCYQLQRRCLLLPAACVRAPPACLIAFSCLPSAGSCSMCLRRWCLRWLWLRW